MLQPMTPRLVLDTNVLLDWLVFAEPRAARLAAAIESRAVQVFANRACVEEFARVLAYRQFGLTPDGQALALDRYRDHLIRHEGPSRPGFLPACRDPDDQKFLELARDAAADCLLTKDKALLDLARPRRRLAGFRILHPDRWPDECA